MADLQKPWRLTINPSLGTPFDADSNPLAAELY
jgi:hypothetical protein